MDALNLPAYLLNIKPIENKEYVFDIFRRKFILLTPEEWVRQNFAHYLADKKSCPVSLISIEQFLIVNRMKKRADIIVYSRDAKPVMIIECKASSVKLSQKVFDQVATYNMPLQVNYLVVTNGLNHYCCRMDYENKSYTFLKDIPNYDQLG